MRRLTSLVTALSLVLSSAPAVAQPSDDAKTAIEQFRTAQKACDAGEFDKALEAAKAAYAQTKSPNAHLYVARALRGLGRLDEAYREMAATLDEASDLAQSEKKYVPTRDAAAAEIALLNKQVGKIVVALADPPPESRVELNGKALPAKELGVPLPILPGKIQVRASAPGMKDEVRELTIAAGATETVAIALSEDGTAMPPPAPEPTAEKPTSGTPWRTVGFVSAGVGVAGLAVFAVAGSMAKSKFNQLEDECGSTRCSDPKYADTVDSGKRSQTIANVGLVVGAVGIVAGGALIVLGGSSSEKAARGPTVDVSSRHVTLGYAGVF